MDFGASYTSSASHVPSRIVWWLVAGVVCCQFGCGPEPPPLPPPKPPVTPTLQWRIEGGQIFREVLDGETGQRTSRDEIFLQGVNWFGMETPDRAPHGLWTGRGVGDFLRQLKGFGLNALRLPLSPEVIQSGHTTADWAQSEAKDGRAMLEVVLAQAQALGLWVILDFHTYDPDQHGGSLPGRPFGGSYTKAHWIRELETLAALAKRFPNIVGIDLCNEPHALDWPAWRALVIEAGQAILKIHPGLLIVVNGVGSLGNTGDHPVHWGENLTDAGELPGIPKDQVLYAPHAYGPDVFAFAYTNATNFPANMPPIWEQHFGHLLGKGFALLIGEFGGKYLAGSKDEVWQNAFVDWLRKKKIRHFLYWALNPNSGDTGGLLQDDWTQVDTRKLKLLQRLIQP